MTNIERENITFLSGNSLSELQVLMNEIHTLIDRKFSHVSEFVPKSVKKQVNEFREELIKERDSREEQD